MTFPSPAGLSFFRFRCLLPFLVFTLAALLGPARAEEDRTKPVSGPAPGWVTERTWTRPAQLQANANGQDYLLIDQQSRLASGENYFHHVYQIVTDSGRSDASQINFRFDPSYQRLLIHHLKLVRGDQVVDKLDLAKMQVLQQERDADRLMYNGERSALFILDDVRVGDVIDLAYTLTGTNPVFGDTFIDTQSVGWSVPVRQLHYRLLVPPGRTLQTRVLGEADVAFERTTTEGEQDLHWSRADIPVITAEGDVPDSYFVYPFLDISEYANWDAVKAWALPLYNDPKDKPTPLLDDLVADIRAKHDTPQRRAIAALDFVQREVRYLGMEMGAGSHKPSEPEEVLRRRFGDCKDKSRLLSVVLQRLGFDAVPALVHSSRHEALYQRLATPYAFDHVIVSLKFEGTDFLLDPTLLYQRGDFLKNRHIGRYGPHLRIAPGPRQGVGPDKNRPPAIRQQSLDDTSLGLADTTKMSILQTFDAPSLDQPAHLVVVTKAEGRSAEYYRSYFANHTPDEIHRDFIDYYTRYYPSITREKDVVVEDTGGSVVKFTEYYRIAHLFEKQDEPNKLRAEFNPVTIWTYVRTSNLGQRRLPYALPFPVDIQEQIVAHLPEDWNIKAEKETLQNKTFILDYAVSQPDPRTVKLDYRWRPLVRRVELAQLPEFSEQLADARRQLGYQLTWTKNPGPEKPSSPEAPAATTKPAPADADAFPPNWPMLALALGVLVAGTHIGWRMTIVSAPHAEEPPVLPGPPSGTLAYGEPRQRLEGLGGWLILVGFGLFIRPAYLLYSLVSGRRAYFNADFWELVTQRSSPSFVPNYSWIAPIELAASVALLVAGIVLIVLFFRRSHLFPKSIQVYFVAMALFASFGAWSLKMTNQPINYEATKDVVQTVGGALVWIPYFRMSRRVKNTFVR